MTRGTEVVVRALLVAAAVAGLLLSSAAEDGVGIQRRSLHQPFFPVDPTPPPGFDDSIVPPPPPPAAGAAAASVASKGGGRSVTNAVAIALATGLVVLAVAFYSCFLLWRRRSDGGGGGAGGDGLRAVKSSRPGAVAVRVASDVGSSARHQRSPPPSSTASDAIYLDPLTTMVEVSRHRPQSPDLRPLALVKQPSPDLRPLPPLKRPAPQPPPPPASTPPMTTTTGDSSDEEDQATYYTAPKTAKSSFSRSTSQRSTVEPTVAQPPAPAPASTPTPPPPQANAPRPGRPPPPPPPPRQRLLRPMPEESPPPAVLASLALTNSPEPSGQDRGGENPDGHSGRTRPPKPPSLKPLHWDKLRAISGRTTVWDQVNNSDSFRVDEAAIESLFLNNSGGVGNSDQAARRGGAGKQESRLLDPKRLQNVAIMLKVLNVTSSDVIGALMHGNGDLGSEFYETLAKMAPTKEEELKLKGYNGDISKLDPAERFLKDVLDVPFAFKRVDAMLYRANFGAEVNYLKKSFGTLEAACTDLRSSKLFLKLLDAVLKTGNRMNDGTNRGEARAFKLDTLLKLADIKSTDGKTTVLHFVVQEIIRSEGLGSDQAAAAAANPGSTSKEQFKKDGLQVLAGLSSELSNVKSAAALEMDTLVGSVSRLETDLEKVTLVSRLRQTCPGDDQVSSEKFFEANDAFLGRAHAEIEAVKAAGERALQRVKETTEYFHGDAVKEEPHPLRIFMVVRDFLATLDRVCRAVGRTPERVMMGSGKSFRVSAGTTSLPQRRNEQRRELSSSDEDSSSS